MTTPLPSSDAHGWPFTEGAGQVVSEHDWEVMASTWQSSGVVGHPEGDTPSAGNRGLFATRISETQIQIQPGVAHVAGHFFELKLPKTLDLDITGAAGWDGSGIRRDVVTLRLDRENSGFVFVQLKAAIDAVNQTLTFEAAGDEIPLVQLNITQNVGLQVEPIDRRWFIGRQVRSIRGSLPYLDPAPYNGELGVDSENNILVVGQGGLWVPASQVFSNDGATGGLIEALQTEVDALEAQVATLETELTDVQGDLTQAQADLAAGLAQIANVAPGPWQLVTITHSSLRSVTGKPLEIRKQGSLIHMRGVIERTNQADMASLLDGQAALLTVPAGFRPATWAFGAASSWGAAAYMGLALEIDSSGVVRLRYGNGDFEPPSIYAVQIGCTWMVG